MVRGPSAGAGRAVGAILLAACVAAAVLAYHSHAGGPSPGATVRYRSVATALRARLSGQHLAYRWVVCTTLTRRFRGVRVSRCNVNFGDPHIQPYCAVLVNGSLITDVENHAVDCGPRVKADEQG